MKFIAMLGIFASFFAPMTFASSSLQTKASVHLDVFKTASCGCCKKWISHLTQSGVSVASQDLPYLDVLKRDAGIAPAYRSCHTAFSSEGYVFEGHVPARYIDAFLASAPENAIGLSVPGMPAGSPGMEMGDRFTPYNIMLLHTDGTASVFAHIASYEDQF
ncbi:DUF411 domain-containing protein [Alteromonas antoniana]|uniref:DUF411 domain-containing protein n=1 Tax=Alteromonas antoniana TaxID=2803813 RepID=UPI001C4435DE|nr:DUF411 domain-containing protein [Alteromonas antoniana]